MKKAWNAVISRNSVRILMLLQLSLLVTISAQGQTQLDSYLKIAATQNPELKAKFSLYLATLERVEHVGALPDPTVSFGYFVSPIETRVGPQNARISLRQMFPWMGTLKVREQVAAGEAKVRFEEFEEMKNKLFREVKDKWLQLYELQEEMEIMQANLDILATYEPVTRTKYEANLVSLADLVRVQISRDNARIKLELLALRQRPLESDFSQLLNRESGLSVLLTDSLTIDNQPGFVEDSIMVHQPQIKALKTEMETMDQRLVLAKLSNKPQIGVGIDYGFVGKRNDLNISDNGKDFFVPTLTLSLPIFKKKNQAAKKMTILEKESFEMKLQAVENELKNAWVNADYEMESATKELELYGQEIANTQALLRILTSEYTNNHRDFEDLLATQQELLQLKLAQVKATVKYHRGLHKKDYLTGYTLNSIR